MRWPSPPPPGPPLLTDSGEAPHPSPAPVTDAGVTSEDSATISQLLLTTAPDALDSSLLRSSVVPSPHLLQCLPLSGLHPTSLLALSRWARPHLVSLVDLLARSRAFDAAWFVLLDAVPAPFPAFAALFRRYARAGMPAAAIRTFDYVRRHPEAVAPSEGDQGDAFELLIDALCKEGHTGAASELVGRRREAEPPGWAPSVRVHNILLHGWFRTRRLRKAEKVWDEMRREGVQPTVVTYGTLIEGLCRMRRPDQANALLEEMRAAKIEPNALTCNPIVDALSEAGRFKDALGMLEKFPLYGVSPNIFTYNSLVKGFCKNGDLVGASKILKTMIARGVLPTPTTYNYFFSFFAKFGKIEEGMNLYNKMIQSGYAPDRLTYQLLIKMLCEKEKLDLAVPLIREMNRNGFDSDLATSTMLMHMLCQMRKYEEACDEFESMIKRGIVPQYITYRILVKELKRLGMLEMERKISRLMDSVRHSTKLPGTYRVKEQGETVDLRKSIMKKAQLMSDTLKISKDSKELSKLKSSTESAMESANRLITYIRRRAYAVKSE
ncbi:pentatricopeptide repeat-containing protein, mitochondrial [Cocos nucifera]|uniref:Pentatricopeptide repeat-containing protein, mitochondrial n=1 Tax=Cocos nucifera TaxID=13894 RepID=A0A8K0IAZ3_COCNU|nr:pentatricopeptide repeat-containing protein, mitochondrial [Cocos nucifera]KAG1346233.1 pentatricopeptide repeat-containing protein, mitochondrial [Cocos nucifera]